MRRGRRWRCRHEHELLDANRRQVIDQLEARLDAAQWQVVAIGGQAVEVARQQGAPLGLGIGAVVLVLVAKHDIADAAEAIAGAKIDPAALELERVELIAAPTAELGIELARARQPDVIIMDINLPGMSGIEAAQQLKQWPETQAIPVIALSAAAMIRDAARVAGAGFYRYLTKPVKVDELMATLEELLVRAR